MSDLATRDLIAMARRRIDDSRRASLFGRTVNVGLLIRTVELLLDRLEQETMKWNTHDC